MSEDFYNNEVDIPDGGVGNVESWDDTFGGDNFGAIDNNYYGDDFIEVNPSEVDPQKKYHPFELEISDENGKTEFRCYYGALYFSIAAIQVEGFDVDGTTRFGIESQSKLPSFGNITPANFIGQEKGDTKKFSVLKAGDNGDITYGTVYLRFWLDSANHTISECSLSFIPKGEEIPDEAPCGELKKVNNKLLREAPTKGRYHIKIGSFNSPEDTPLSITQTIEDHLYYATTIVDVSEAPAPSDGTTYSQTTIADEENPYGTFEAPPEQDTTNNLPTATNQPNFIPTGESNKAAQPNQPNPETPLFGTLDATQPDAVIGGTEEDPNLDSVDTVPTVDHTGGFFGGHGAAGSSAPSDGTGYVETGSISSVSSLIAIQEDSPTGSAGGSPSSSA